LGCAGRFIRKRDVVYVRIAILSDALFNPTAVIVGGGGFGHGVHHVVADTQFGRVSLP
jgi:hypothetical protein